MNEQMNESMRWQGQQNKEVVPFIYSRAFIKYPSTEEGKSRTHYVSHNNDDHEKDKKNDKLLNLDYLRGVNWCIFFIFFGSSVLI